MREGPLERVEEQDVLHDNTVVGSCSRVPVLCLGRQLVDVGSHKRDAKEEQAVGEAEHSNDGALEQIEGRECQVGKHEASAMDNVVLEHQHVAKQQLCVCEGGTQGYSETLLHTGLQQQRLCTESYKLGDGNDHREPRKAHQVLCDA